MGFDILEQVFEGQFEVQKIRSRGRRFIGYVDADYACNMDTRKSLSGFVLTLYGTTIICKKNQQSIVAI
jgi:hypothetical protein